MSKFIMIMAVMIAVITYVGCDQTKQATFTLSNFVGYRTEIVWTEHMTNGETRYLVKWQEKEGVCSAVVSELNNKYWYKTPKSCFTKGEK